MEKESQIYHLLACPKCRGDLTHHHAPEGFVCAPCQLFYPIEDGIPNMIIEEAKRWPLSDTEKK